MHPPPHTNNHQHNKTFFERQTIKSHKLEIATITRNCVPKSFFGQRFPPLSCLHCERRGAISTSPTIEIPVTSDHVVQFQPNIVIQITFGLFMNETLRKGETVNNPGSQGEVRQSNVHFSFALGMRRCFYGVHYIWVYGVRRRSESRGIVLEVFFPSSFRSFGLFGKKKRMIQTSAAPDFTSLKTRNISRES